MSAVDENDSMQFELISKKSHYEIWARMPSRLVLVVPIVPMDHSLEQTKQQAEFILKAMNDSAAPFPKAMGEA